MKVRYKSIILADVGDFIQTRWGNDLIHLKVEKVIHMPSDTYVAKETECSIFCVDLDHYEDNS